MQIVNEILSLFIRLGFTAFGGPAAHIAMMRREVVAKKQWMDDGQFLNLVGLTNLIPGPNSTELAIHIGKEKGGAKGLVIAGICFILPAVLITIAFAWMYKEYGTLPQAEPFIYGVRAVVIPVILVAVYPLARASLKSNGLIVVGIAALVLAFIGINEVFVMFGVGLLYLIYNFIKAKKAVVSVFPVLFFAPVKAASNSGLFWVFLKIGAILYGSGYVLFAFIEDELVAKGLLSREQLMDAISVGQITPGPVFSSVTFIGYQINGLMGAMLSTLGVFIPSFIFVSLIGYFKGKLLRSILFKAFLDAINVASVAIIAVVCLKMGQEALTDWRTIAIAVLGFLILWFRPSLNSAYIILFGSIFGYLLMYF
ncbi:chromate efflux transporter [Flavobacterium sp. AG291]|uniref:chromate efflux transporter n=1 Tax=Flavobacterium sp. AG291 TaxID=2184000 RepID=UPI000E0B2CF6|nr:chromate efflux transporter [Flavobacterium sp. AG291]RDI09756.1 chromate transporter [Flavobacterium sp. AG291]